MQTQKNERLSTRFRRYLISNAPPPAAERSTRLLSGALRGAAAYVLCRAPLLFSVNPLPLALLCATEQGLGWVIGGILLSLWQTGGPQLPFILAAVITIFPLRLLGRLFLTPQRPTDSLSPEQLRRDYFRCRTAQLRRLCLRGGEADTPAKIEIPVLPPLFDEPISLRVAASLLASLIPAIGIPSVGGFAYYDLYGAVFTLLLTPVATVLFSAAFSYVSSRRNLPWGHIREWILPALGSALLLWGICFCGRELSLLGFAPSVLLSVLLVLLAVRRYGLGAGLVLALVCGLGYDPLIIPMLLCLGGMYALLTPLIGQVSLLPAALGATVYLLICGDALAFRALMPSLVGGILLFFVILRSAFARTQTQQTATSTPCWTAQELHVQLYLENNRHEGLKQRMSAISGAFSGLSEVVRQLDGRAAYQDSGALRALCEGILEGYCPDCPHYTLCHQEEALETLRTLCALQEGLSRDKRVSESALHEALRRRCPHKQAFLHEINESAARLASEQIRQGGSEHFATECDEISRLLRDLLRRDGEAEVHSDPMANALQEKIGRQVALYLEALGLKIRGILWQAGTPSKLRLFGLSPAALPLPADAFRHALEEKLGQTLSAMTYDPAEDGTITFEVAPSLRADYVHRAVAVNEQAGMEAINTKKSPMCGDTLRIFEDKEGKFYALLCDGMGKGAGAALTSGVCGVFLERALCAGVEIPTALRLLNHYLRSRSADPAREISSTVDLFVLDLYTGQAQFVKSGAAPTLVMRQGRMFRLASHTFPIGILQATDVQIIPFNVQPGDHILLMSDGITDAAEEGAENDWLLELLEESNGTDGSEPLSATLPDDGALIQQIFVKARANGSCDDMSVISIRIGKEE